jgi:hypothetical protein
MTLRIRLIFFTLFSFLSAFGQSDEINALVKSFNSYQSKTVQEKVFVHTDRNFFVTGEVLWLKVYCMEATSNALLDLSTVAYAEILSVDNKPILQTKIELSQGTGYGSIFLPASINSGNYVLRVYTNWMKNFSSEFYFHQSLTIVNPFRKLEPQEVAIQTPIELKFYPEGGRLVKGLTSTVAFKVTDGNGKSLNADGVILGNGKDTVTRITTMRFGMGKFNFTPQPNHTYEAIIFSEKSKQRFKLPVALDSGCTVHLSELDDSKIRLSVQGSFQPGTPLFLVVHSENNIKAAKSNVVIDGKTQFVFNKDQLGKGPIHFTLFDNSLNPICERLYFIKSNNKINLNVVSDKASYYTRQKISLTIDAVGSALSPNLNGSISIHAMDSLLRRPSIDIATFTNLVSELRGNIESPEFYLAQEDELTNQALDNLVLVHGWSRYNWNKILTPDEDSILSVHPPELRGHLVTGKITKKLTAEPISEVTTLLGAPNKIIRSYVSLSNTEGNIYFEMKDFFDAQRIFVSVLDEKNDSIKIQINDPFSAKLSSYNALPFRLSPATEQALIQKSVAMQSLSVFQPDYVGKYSLTQTDSINFYGKADEDYLLDDYTRFKSMEEVMREYVPGIFVKKKKDDFVMRVINKPVNRLFEKHPLVLLDGVPVFNANKVMEYDPLKIRRLEVMTRLYYVGALEANGVVSFTSYKGLAEGLEIDPNSISLDYSGLQRKKEFYSPDYSTVPAIQSRLADFRDLLYWNPSLSLEKDEKINIEFYSSDKTGKYEISVQGITKEGKPAVGYSTFTVVK